ncbi:GTPase [Zophobihabitans entericus]|uniref:GTPase n=1 Tax=Zophobihabitans entericus TaxID=1635327 RepID=A0A6G9IBA7_9GAMM|nr:GTPase [Zophobihabitans entericus]QIQ21516.1 GTPase [Zophobihabitans entericus]
MNQPLPVTVLTGFLGAGKTTLLSHILNTQHGFKIAVIENEFSDTSIDDQLLADKATTITTLSNGCICCSSANELADALQALLTGLDNQELDFDRLVIECTGMADPGPITQTFFSHPVLCERFLLDGIITLVDAVHAEQQLDKFNVAQAQIGYADRILLTKTDIAPQHEQLTERLQKINARAPIYNVLHGDIDLSLLFDIEGFILNDKLTVSTPTFKFIPSVPSDVSSVVIELDKPIELSAVSDLMEGLLLKYADQLLRYKGLLAIKDDNKRLLFQGVQRLYSADWDRQWKEDEERKSILVFIGVNLPEQEIRESFAGLLQ